MRPTHTNSIFRLFQSLTIFVLVSAWLSGPCVAAYYDADCHALKLQAASGVPAEKKHEYQFVGTCNLNVIKKSGPDVIRTVPAEASGQWDKSAKTFKERFHILAPVHLPAMSVDDGTSFKLGAGFESSSTNFTPMDVSAGYVDSIFKCNNDPLISNASCIMTSHSNKSGFEAFSNPAVKQHRPLLKGKTTLAEATALSKQNPASNPSPAKAPPPSPSSQPKHMLSSPEHKQPVVNKTTRTAQNVTTDTNRMLSRRGPIKLVVEGENLVKAGEYQVAGGHVAVQSMTGFGKGWSANSQLLWKGGSVGAVLDLIVAIKEPGKYVVELYMTRAPDYANLKLEVDGKASPVPINLFAPKVMTTGPLQAGTFSLQAGQRKFAFMIVSKYPQSKDYFVGLDRIVLSRIGPP